MFEDLLPIVEKGILEASGVIPVVFEGLERNFEKSSNKSLESRHGFHELIYIRSGDADFLVEGEVIPVHRRSSIIIRPGASHVIRLKSQRADTVVLRFGFSNTLSVKATSTTPAPGSSTSFSASREHLSSEKYYSRVAPKTLESFLDFANGNEMGEKGNAPYLIVSGKSSAEIGHAVEHIVAEWGKDAFAKELMIQFLTMELLIALARALREEWEESLRVRLGKARELVLIARDFLVENHDRGVTVADAAAYVFLSQGYFTRAFRDELGISPMGFLMQVRVNHACKLLAQEEIKVSGVALQVGFSSPQRFNVAFRKQMGMTPIQYRQTILAKNK